MLAAGWGRVVNISSSSAQGGSARMSAYSSSKGAVISLTKSLALELASSGATVNNIPPGFVDTPMLRQSDSKNGFSIEKAAAASPMKRPGRPEDIVLQRLVRPLKEASLMASAPRQLLAVSRCALRSPCAAMSQ